MKHKTLMAMAALSMTATALAGNYKVTAPLGEDEEGAMAYIVNYDNGDKIDSVLVSDGAAVFTGTVDEPLAARLIIDGNRYGMFFLEPADIVIDAKERKVAGGELNAANERISQHAAQLSQEYRNAQDDDTRKAIMQRYEDFVHKAYMDNSRNALGYVLFMDRAYDMTPLELQEALTSNPSLKKYDRINKLIKANEAKASTQPGNMFADFEIEYDGVKHRLSDVVGKGDYVLVDYWASWCGPCIRQTQVIKDIYAKYKDKGLKVLGVAVWDEPQNTLNAIKQHDLPWESWLNGGNIPTDTYGISGIPCIILYGPDGTILSRDKQSEELVADVDAAMSGK